MSKTSLLRSSALLASAIAALPAFAQVSYTGGTYSESFDGLGTATVSGAFVGTVGVQTAVPGVTGWAGTRSGGSGTGAMNLSADTGSANGGTIYSYGAASDSDRALGVLSSGTTVPTIGTEIVNNTGGTITSVTISFTSEFWRSSTSLQNILTFAYGVSGGTITSSDYLTNAGMTALAALNVTGPAPVTTNGALDGNAAENQAVVTATINGLLIPNGGSLYLRWADVNDAGNDAGLAIDNFSLTAMSVAPGAEVSRGASTLFTSTSFGGNTFTANDTAVFDGTAAAVQLSGAVTASALKFTTDGYSLTGSASDSISLNSGSITTNEGVNATISGIIAGSNGLTKLGAGTLTLSGANTFTGAVSISSGTLAVSSDANLGNADNDINLSATLATSASSLSLASGRTLSGSGTIQTASSGTLSFAGPVAAGALTINGATTINFGGATNTVASLALAVPSTINVTGGALQLTASSGTLALAQTSGTTTITGPVAFAAGDKPLIVPGGSLSFNGSLTYGGGRLVKTGLGTLDLTSITPSGSGGVRLGVQGGSPSEGGTLIIDSDADLGNVTMHINSGTLYATQPITTSIGLSIGSRRGSGIAPVVLDGADMVFNGTVSTGFGFYNSGAGTLGFNVNNTTTITYDIPAVSASPIGWVEMGGTGTLIYSGDASLLTDNYAVADSLTFVLDGTFGGKLLAVDPSATLSGQGTFTGSALATDVAANLATISGTLAPSGTLTFNSGLSLQGATVLGIDGAVSDGVSVVNLTTDGSVSYTLTYGGTLTLDFVSAAANGTYSLFTTGANVTRSGGFSTVSLAGSYTGSLTNSGGVWSGIVSGVTFSFDESTGVLTVSGAGPTLSAIEEWRLTNFGTSENTGTAADSADFDGDGIPNLIEYATGTEPDAFNVGAVTSARSGAFLTLSYPTIGDSSLTYTVEATSDLSVTFTPATGTSATAGGITTYTDDVSLSTAGVRRFLRLSVTRAD